MSNPSDSALEAQIGTLKALTANTGALHEAQALQLKTWPLMIIPDSTKAEAEFDYKGKSVVYKVKRSKKSKIKDIDLRAKALTQYTRTLLGDEYNIEIYINGGLIFSSEQNAG